MVIMFLLLASSLAYGEYLKACFSSPVEYSSTDSWSNDLAQMSWHTAVLGLYHSNAIVLSKVNVYRSDLAVSEKNNESLSQRKVQSLNL
jgi:hypothetical protein